MGVFLGLVGLGIAFAAVMAGLVLLGGRARRRGASMIVIDHVDAIFRPATHHYRHEIQLQDERQLPGASADDKPASP